MTSSTYAVDRAYFLPGLRVDGYPAGGCTPAVPGHLTLPCRLPRGTGPKLPEAADSPFIQGKQVRRGCFRAYTPGGEQRRLAERSVSPSGSTSRPGSNDWRAPASSPRPGHPSPSTRALSNGRRA